MEKINKNFIPSEIQTEEEINLWTKLATQLIELEIINSLNYLILVRYCQLYIVVQNYIKKYPSNLTSIKQFNRELKNLEEELCLTPQSYNKFIKDRLIIQDREQKQNKKNKEIIDKAKEGYIE